MKEENEGNTEDGVISIADVRKCKGWENCTQEQAEALIEFINVFTDAILEYQQRKGTVIEHPATTEFLKQNHKDKAA